MGAAAVMANTAIATAGDVPAMANAFKLALKQEEKHTLQEWEESWQEAAAHLIRLQAFYVRRQRT